MNQQAIDFLKKWASAPKPKHECYFPAFTDRVCPKCKKRALSRWMHAYLNGWKCQNCDYEEEL